jgi:tRNA G18 (ribose-2'-O)-methylase SpoU
VSAAPLVSRFRSARTDGTLAVLEGFHAIKHALRFGAEITVMVTRNAGEVERLAAELAPDVWPAMLSTLEEITPALYAELTPTPAETGIVALARRRMTSVDELAVVPSAAPMVLLEAPSHPGNVGAAIRASAGAGAAAVLTTGPHDPWQPAALRGSAGLHYALPVVRVESPSVPCRRLIAIDPDGAPLDATAIPPGALLAFGSERSGLSETLLAQASDRLRIPMAPGVSSLNLATAVAVTLYTWRYQQRARA